jgi:hypothetical protein
MRRWGEGGGTVRVERIRPTVGGQEAAATDVSVGKEKCCTDNALRHPMGWSEGDSYGNIRGEGRCRANHALRHPLGWSGGGSEAKRGTGRRGKGKGRAGERGAGEDVGKSCRDFFIKKAL